MPLYITEIILHGTWFYIFFIRRCKNIPLTGYSGSDPMRDMKKTIGKSEKIYLFLWVVFLLVLLVIVEYISEAPVVIPFLKKIAGRFCK